MIGRSSFADVVLADGSVASHHAELVVTDDGRFYLTDCGTATGTWRRVAGAAGSSEAADPRTSGSQTPPLWEPVRQAFVGGEERLRLGEYGCTVRDLLGLASERPQPGGERFGPGSPAAAERWRLRGRVERDPRTGEIVRKRP